VPASASRSLDCDDPPPPELIKGVEEFNGGRFYEQHETLELLWRDTATPVRDLYHGILQIGVGLHHWRGGNFHGATVLLAEGIARLEPFAPDCHAIDVAALVTEAREIQAELIRLGPTGMPSKDPTGAVRVRWTGPR
jgi:hypothetical protein